MFQANFESRITSGLTQWITFIKTDDNPLRICIGLTHRPENIQTERIVKFCDVKSVTSDWFDRDDKSMESIIGACENQLENSIQYIFSTDQRELRISTMDFSTIIEGNSYS